MATEEERLQEIVEEMKYAYMKDMRDKSITYVGDDYEKRYPKFLAVVKEKADLYKGMNQWYRQLCCLPSFALGLVMVSKIKRHYTHSNWFKQSKLGVMIEVYGGVSKRFIRMACANDDSEVYLRIYGGERRGA